MKQLMISCGLALAVTTQAASAASYVELGDAGQTLGTVQSVAGGTTVTYGSLGGYGSGDVDMYRFAWGGGAFTANTFGSAHGDPMLWLFDASGRGIQGDDDSGASGDGLDAVLDVAALQAGIYYLAVSPFVMTPRSGGNFMFTSFVRTAAADPNAVLDSWDGIDTGPAPGIDPSYQINLPATAALDGGTTGAEVPEPATLALLGAGLFGLGLARRARHRSA